MKLFKHRQALAVTNEPDFTDNNLELDDLEYEDDDDETLSVWDAAEIWASHGKDEDYTFGYTEEELEDAL